MNNNMYFFYRCKITVQCRRSYDLSQPNPILAIHANILHLLDWAWLQ